VWIVTKRNMKLDKWQNEVLSTKGNICLCSGRQVGKSTIIAMKAGEDAVKNKNQSIMVISATERQALLLFEKILSHIFINHKKMIRTGKDRPTKHEIKLRNGSIIRCLPTGDSGYGIRGFTIHKLYADEAHFIKEEVWAAITPALATTGGDIILLSTPFGTEGYFYRCFNDKKFTSFHISTEEVAKDREEMQRKSMQMFLKDEKERMTKLQYQQEYLGLFVGGIQRLFPDEIIDQCCTLAQGSNHSSPSRETFLGIDIARMGGDETVLCSVNRTSQDTLEMFDIEIPDSQTLTDTTRLILHKDRQYNYKKIYIDDGGLGVGVFDTLLENEQTKRKIIAINNSKRAIDREKGKKTLFKEDLYNNLVKLMEEKRIKIFDMPEIKHSLRSIQYEHADDGRLRIYGNYSHIAEALIRAAWALKDKSLKLFVYT
jgi:hypothetical protein